MRDGFKNSMSLRLRRVLPTITLLALALFTSSVHSASKAVLVLGDSLSAEYGLVRGTGWVALLQKRLSLEHIPAPIINASISGETTSGGRTRLPALLQEHKPSVVVVELGANDGLRGLSLTAAEDNLRAIVSASQKAGATVLLLGMQIPPNYGTEYTKAFASTYQKIAKGTKSPLVPFFLEAIVRKPELLQPDRLHPTAEAQPTILDTIWPYLKPLLAKPLPAK
jgi:acyl-CoA thioesterase-1